MSACSSINIDYLLESKSEYGNLHQMNIDNIIGAIESIGSDGVFVEFDNAGSVKTLDTKQVIEPALAFLDAPGAFLLSILKLDPRVSPHAIFMGLDTLQHQTSVLKYKVLNARREPV